MQPPLRILLATDGSEDAAAAARFVRLLPLSPGSTVRLLCVVTSPRLAGGPALSGIMGELAAEQQERAAAIVEQAARAVAREGVETSTRVRHGPAAPEILLAALEFEADLVVAGSRGLSGRKDLVLGSVARTVAAAAERPVLVARAPRHELREVVVATDGSHAAEAAADFLARLPLPARAAVTAVHVILPYTPFPRLIPDGGPEMDRLVEEVRRKQKERGAELLAEIRSRLPGATHRQELRIGDPANEIRAVAEERQADLIVVGARGSSLTQGLSVGSVTDRLMRDARCSVLIVR